MKAIDQFIARVAATTLPNVFNPYRDQCPLYDRPNAVAIRRANLRTYLDAALTVGVDSIWFGRDLGYRGGRRTGIALTDEAHLPLLAMLCDTQKMARATHGEAIRERTATVVWEIIAEIKQLPFLWNAFPFHPHEPDAPMTNRTHSRSELATIWDLNQALLDLIQPRKFIAIGNDARDALSRQGLACDYVRHPSYGGQADFVSGLRRLYDCTDDSSHNRLRVDGQQLFAFSN